MNRINVNRITEYYAKKHCIDLAIEYFQGNPDKYFTLVVLNWSDPTNGEFGECELVVRREVISMFFGIDIVKAKEFDIRRLGPCNKREYLELFEAIRFHAPRDENIKEALRLSEKLFLIEDKIRKFNKRA